MARIKEAGDSALVLELEPLIDPRVNARAIAIAAALRTQAVSGVRDVVSTFRSVAVYFDPLVADVASVRAALERASAASGDVGTGRSVEVPVVYGGEGGPDLQDVAAFAGLSPEQVVERHVSAEYRVFMLGFLPGFAYLGTVAPEIAAPRRATPRLRVPAGSVGVAGRQTAVYPRESPGGWQIIGRTSMQVFDPEKTPSAMFSPGDSVRFIRRTSLVPPAPEASARLLEAHDAREGGRPPRASVTTLAPHERRGTARTITVIRPGLSTTVQDSGRWGHQSSGVPVSGAMDVVSHRAANALVGNDPAAAALEATLVGPELRIESQMTIAITGANLAPAIDGAAVALNTPTSCPPGSVLRFGERREGTRAYIAFGGGIAVPPVLGSRATHTMSALGGMQGRSLAAGDWCAIGDPARSASPRRLELPLSSGNGGVRVRVLPGPQEEFFPEEAFETLQRSRYSVAPQSNRMGYHLQGTRIPRVEDREMISDATFTGAIQVPASGEPILLMADRQTTGGYPQIAVVITADLPLAAQLAPGDWIEFRICSRADAVAALVSQEGKLLAIR